MVSSILTAFMGSLATSSIVGAVVVILIKRMIDSAFEKRIETTKRKHSEEFAQLSAEIDIIKRRSTLILEARSQSYPLLVEGIDRLRVRIREAIQVLLLEGTDKARSTEASQAVSTSFAEMKDILAKNRLLVSGDIYSEMHDLKNSINSIMFVLGSLDTRPDLGKARSDLIAGFEALDQMVKSIVRGLQGEIGIIQCEANVHLDSNQRGQSITSI